MKIQLGSMGAHNVKLDSQMYMKMEVLDSIYAKKFQKFIKNVGLSTKLLKNVYSAKRVLT